MLKIAFLQSNQCINCFYYIFHIIYCDKIWYNYWFSLMKYWVSKTDFKSFFFCHNVHFLKGPPDWKNYTDQAYSCPREDPWKPEKSQGPHQGHALKTPPISQHYGTEGFKGWPWIGPPLWREASVPRRCKYSQPGIASVPRMCRPKTPNKKVIIK